MRRKTRPQYAAGQWQGNQLRWRIPQVARGQALRASHINLMSDAINGNLVPPQDLTKGVIDDGNKLRFAPVEGRTVWSGRVENPDDENQYVIAEQTTQLVIRITSEMLPIQANDLWIVSLYDDGSVDARDQPDVFTDLREDWQVTTQGVLLRNLYGDD